jgi:hypothetical protein
MGATTIPSEAQLVARRAKAKEYRIAKKLRATAVIQREKDLKDLYVTVYLQQFKPSHNEYVCAQSLLDAVIARLHDAPTYPLVFAPCSRESAFIRSVDYVVETIKNMCTKLDDSEIKAFFAHFISTQAKERRTDMHVKLFVPHAVMQM